MEQICKSEYSYLKDTGQLKDIDKTFTGNWEEDKNKFITMYEQNQQALQNMPLTLESLYDDDDDED